MTTAYTSLLGLALPVTGELSGTWGDTVNDYITQYLDASVAGTQTISGSQTAVTLSKTTNASLSQAGSGATGSSQYNVINCTGNPASMLTVTVPAASKTYVVVNATSTNQDVKIVGAGPTTGVTLVAGERAIIAWNGSDFIKVATSTVDGVSTIAFGTTGLTPSSATSGAVTVAGTLVAANGGTGQSSYTTGDLLYATGSTALSKLGIGTNGQILTSTGTAPQWSTLSGVAVTTFSAGTTGFTPSVATSGAITLAGTLATTNGGTGLTSFTANRVFYSSSTSAIGSSANLTFDGTTLTANALTTTSTVTINGGTANGVAYLNGSKVLTTGSALTFDGSAFQTSLGTGLVTNTKQLVLNNFSGEGVGITFSRPTDSTEVNAIGTASSFWELGLFGREGIVFATGGGSTYSATTEQMRLTSTGLGIGTSSPATKLHLYTPAAATTLTIDSGTSGTAIAYSLAGVAKYTAEYVSASDFYSIGRSGVAYDLILKSGNLGLGVTPSAWGGNKAVQVNARTSLYSSADGGAVVGNNLYYNGTSNIYIASNYATAYQQNAAGQHIWYNAPSGTAGDPISFSQVMTLDASGNLGIGTSSPNTRLHIVGLNQTNGTAEFTPNAAKGSNASYVHYGTNGDWYIRSASASGNVNIQDTGGNVGIGTSSPSYKLQVAGTVGVSGIITSTVTSGQVVKAESGGTGILYSNFTNTGGTFLYGIDNSTGSAIFSGSSNYAGFIGTSGATPLVFATNGTVRATLDSSGNLGLGVTPSAWADYKALQMPGAAFLGYSDGSGNNQAIVAANCYWNGANWIYRTTDQAARYSLYDGQAIWFNAPSGTAGTAISFTQALTLHASGGLSLGNTSDPGAKNLSVSGDISISGSGTGARLRNQINGVSVSTSATTIIDGGDLGQLVVVNGSSGSDRFCDLVMSSTGASPVVVQSFTASGSPVARTYTRSGSNLQLAMASGTYTVFALSLGF